jgi:hypothetical protein
MRSITFKYDPLGRRIQKAFTQGSTTTTSNYVYDGDNSVQDVDQNGNLLARYAEITSIDEPLAESRSAGGPPSAFAFPTIELIPMARTFLQWLAAVDLRPHRMCGWPILRTVCEGWEALDISRCWLRKFPSLPTGLKRRYGLPQVH